MLDTGSSWIWVPSGDCASCNEKNSKFDSYTSNTFARMYSQADYSMT